MIILFYNDDGFGKYLLFLFFISQKMNLLNYQGGGSKWWYHNTEMEHKEDQ